MDKGLLYFGGFGAGIFYRIGDIVGGAITPGWRYTENAVSELIQSGAANKVFLSLLLSLHALMIVLFSIGMPAYLLIREQPGQPGRGPHEVTQ